MKFLAVSMLLTLSMRANALDSIRPGLWEIHSVTKSKSGNFEKMISGVHAQVMKNMTAEEKKIYQESMAEQGVTRLGPESIFKDCVTKEQAAKMEIPRAEKNCSQEIVKHTGTNAKVKIKCSGEIPATGDADFKLEGPKAYTLTANMDTVLAGRSEKLNVISKGKWIADDCGKVQSSMK